MRLYNCAVVYINMYKYESEIQGFVYNEHTNGTHFKQNS